MDGFPGDPGHEGTSKPMQSLQGSCGSAPTQQPMTSEAMTNPRSAAADNIGQTWDATVLGTIPAGTGNNDKAEAH